MEKEKRVVRRVEITTSIHATEDDVKVKKAVLNLIPDELRNKVKIKQLTFQGHYGNPIKRLTLTITGGNADKVFKNIISKMTETDRRIIDTTLDNRLTSSHLYIRLSKQEAYQGNIVLYEGDDIIKIVATLNCNVSKEDLRNILRGKIEGGK
ncbi:MAG TPA: hypothetical protein ENG44_01780 [Desulfurococcaceae archaeon]|nr:hypothetical protein [Desulfurococcaceae archaeon]